MQYVLTILIVAAIAIGGWYFFTQTENEPAATSEQDTAMDDDTENDTDDMDSADMDTDADADTLLDADMSVDADVSADADVTVDITGTNYAFDVTEIRVTEGDVVTVNFTSAEGFHDWMVDEFDASTARVQAGGVTSVTFTADQAGTFEYYCSVGDHRAQGMVGTLVVEPAS